MKRACRVLLIASMVAAGWLAGCFVRAGVVVFANRTQTPVQFRMARQLGAAPEAYRLAPGETVSIPVHGDAQVAYEADGAQHEFLVAPDAIYFFAHAGGKLQFSQLVLAGSSQGLAGPFSPATALPAPSQAVPTADPIARIPVKVLVDDDEPAVERIWQKRLNDRMAEASKIFERLVQVRFEVVAMAAWDSDDSVNDFDRSLAEFEAEVAPAPAMLAIGFTSQYPADHVGHALGGTRGPLYPWILIREWSSQITEVERLEILVHELGHYLGAAHSAEANSAMRPKMTDRRARARSFRIGFDPLNMLAMCLVAEEIRLHRSADVLQFRPTTLARLRDLYAAMAKALPDDRATAQYARVLDRLCGLKAEPAPPGDPLAAGTRAVVETILAAARENDVIRRRCAAGVLKNATFLAGDRLTEHLVRRAAHAAKGLPAEVAADAFLLGLGIGLDDSSLLRSNPVIVRLGPSVESQPEREERLAVLGTPTMGGRSDLAQHFVVSGALAVLVGPQTAETIGVFKELRDAQRGSGFSFVDLAADLAGVAFASHVRQRRISLDALATSFAVGDFLLPAVGLREGIPWKTFASAYGSPEDERFAREVAAIRARIAQLPGYTKP